MNIDIEKDIKTSIDVEYLTDMNRYIDIDIANLDTKSTYQRKIEASMYSITPEKYEAEQRKAFVHLKDLIAKRLEELNKV